MCRVSCRDVMCGVVYLPPWVPLVCSCLSRFPGLCREVGGWQLQVDPCRVVFCDICLTVLCLSPALMRRDV